ncbi:hypothetical protein K438DRAFT_1676891 [Mycena galopus ATCC 62051]|nr:hypothetical protein K438DRAFT_1676891 [Mycena galopus ATCC 62051]
MEASAMELPVNMTTAVAAPSSHLFHNATNFEIRGGQYILGDVHNHHTDAGPPLSTSLAPVNLDGLFSESEVYCNELLRRKRGFPLYEPAPQISLPAAYRRDGVSIGDVGSVTAEGMFDFFFNIFLPPEHSINGHRTPEDFCPMQPYESVDVFDLHFHPGNHVSSSTVRRLDLDIASEKFPGGDFVFNCDGIQGAVLALPYGAHLKKLRNVENIRAYATEHAASWYRYINGPRGRGLANGELYLVTGCEKARSWGMASYYPNNQQFDLVFRPIDGGYRWSGTPGMKNPSQKKSHDHPQVDDQPLNHTTFIHGLSISIGTGLWSRLFGTVTVETSSIAEFYSRLNATGGSYAAGSSPPFWSWNFFGAGGGAGGKHHTARHEEVILSEVPSNSGRVWNPGKLINEYILYKVPSATVVMSHNDDWSSILGDYPEVTSPAVFLQWIEDRYVIKEEYGATFLVSKSIRSSTVTENEGDRSVGFTSVMTNLSEDPSITPTDQSSIAKDLVSKRDVESKMYNGEGESAIDLPRVEWMNEAGTEFSDANSGPSPDNRISSRAMDHDKSPRGSTVTSAGTRVCFWSGSGKEMYGTVQKAQRANDGTIIVSIRTDAGTSVSLPAASLSKV